MTVLGASIRSMFSVVANVSSLSIGPHHWRACLPPLAARIGASPVQDRRSGVQSLAWTRAAIPRSTSPTYLAADRSVPLPPTVWQCLMSSWQPSPTNRAFPVAGS